MKNKPKFEKNSYSVNEFAELLGKAPATVRKWCERALFPKRTRESKNSRYSLPPGWKAIKVNSSEGGKRKTWLIVPDLAAETRSEFQKGIEALRLIPEMYLGLMEIPGAELAIARLVTDKELQMRALRCLYVSREIETIANVNDPAARNDLVAQFIRTIHKSISEQELAALIADRLMNSTVVDCPDSLHASFSSNSSDEAEYDYMKSFIIALLAAIRVCRTTARDRRTSSSLALNFGPNGKVSINSSTGTSRGVHPVKAVQANPLSAPALNSLRENCVLHGINPAEDVEYLFVLFWLYGLIGRASGEKTTRGQDYFNTLEEVSSHPKFFEFKSRCKWCGQLLPVETGKGKKTRDDKITCTEGHRVDLSKFKAAQAKKIPFKSALSKLNEVEEQSEALTTLMHPGWSPFQLPAQLQEAILIRLSKVRSNLHTYDKADKAD
jgi:hypothetical protein